MTDNTRTGNRSRTALIVLVVIAIFYGVLTGMIPTARAADTTLCAICGPPKVWPPPVSSITASTDPATIQAIVNDPTAMTQEMATKLLQVGSPTEVETESIETPLISNQLHDASEVQTLASAGGNALTLSIAEGSSYESLAATKTAVIWHHSIVSGNSTTGCGGTIAHTKRAYIFVSVVIGWRQAIQAGWCWNSTRITTVGAHYRNSWAAGGYCYSDVSFTNIGWVGSPGAWREFRLSNQGQLHINVPKFSCGTVPFDSFRTIVPRVYYHRGGGYNYGTHP